MSLSCATCKSTNVQKLSLAYQNGLSDINGTQKTSGVGISRRGLGFGSSRSKFNGTQQSALSQKASPPLKERVIKNAFIHLAMAFIATPFVALLIFSNEIVSGVAILLYLAFAIHD
ncbi:hypothetical protein, partial [Chitinivibrio alkaliphilus]|uniref:hypothetical protein n=1 Tax=Chitinivibrio alkaliphilus TaxID=1505232 RepID=UPI000554C60D